MRFGSYTKAQKMPRPVSVGEISAKFHTEYGRKSTERRDAIDKALRLMATDLHYPSLRARKMSGHRSIWEAHATLGVVMTFDFIGTDRIRLRVCCNHNIYRRP